MFCWPCRFTVTGIYFGDSSQPLFAREESQQPLAAAVPRTQKQQNSTVHVPAYAKALRGKESTKRNKSVTEVEPAQEVETLIPRTSTILSKGDTRLSEKTGEKGHGNNTKLPRLSVSSFSSLSASQSSSSYSSSSSERTKGNRFA